MATENKNSEGMVENKIRTINMKASRRWNKPKKARLRKKKGGKERQNAKMK